MPKPFGRKVRWGTSRRALTVAGLFNPNDLHLDGQGHHLDANG
jgi:hypothetical protein